MTAHILIVEDDAALREVIARVLRKAGYQTTDVPDGETAIDLLHATTTQPRSPYDVVLTDIVMGEVDGVSVTRAARGLPDAPEVILLTGHGSLETAMAALHIGAFDYRLKPLRLTDLLERIAAAVEHRTTRLLQSMQANAWSKIVNTVSEINHITGDRAGDAPAATASPSSADLPPSNPPDAHPTGQPSDERRFLEVGKLRIDVQRHQVWFADESLRVTPTEYTILECLAEQPGCVISYAEIVRRTHGSQINERDAHSLLRTHIRNLRRKLDKRYLVSVRSVGYMLDDATPQNSDPTTSS